MQPPEDLDGEALLEWGRISQELTDAKIIEPADRAVMILYVRTWATWKEADKMVAKFGSVIKYSNGMPGPAPFFKTAMESGKQVRALLDQLGLSPAARHKMKAIKSPDANEPAGDLEF